MVGIVRIGREINGLVASEDQFGVVAFEKAAIENRNNVIIFMVIDMNIIIKVLSHDAFMSWRIIVIDGSAITTLDPVSCPAANSRLQNVGKIGF